MRRSLFITGSDGYLGSHVLRQIDPARYNRIHCLTRSAGRWHGASNVTFFHGDVLDPGAYRSALAECDTVLHMAAVTGKAPAEAYFRVNRDGTQMLLDTARAVGVRRVLFISSIAAAFRDQRRYPYAQSKRQAEQLVERCGLEYLIVRPTILMGPAAPVIVGLSKLAAAPIVPVFGTGRVRVQPVSAGDLATCLLNMIEHSAGLANSIVEIGGPETMTIEELLVRIRRIRYGKSARVVHLPAAPIAAVLAALEKILLPVLPLTSGQLASFTNEGTTHNNSGFRGACAPHETLEDVLCRA